MRKARVGYGPPVRNSSAPDQITEESARGRQASGAPAATSRASNDIAMLLPENACVDSGRLSKETPANRLRGDRVLTQTLEMDRELASALAQQTARVMLNIMSVTLINPFEVPPGREEDAVAYWNRCADVLRRQPGFISARLHRAIMPGARFALVNVAEWESAEHFQTAVSTSDFQAVAAPEASDFPHSPAMYDIVRTVH